eukprot:Em0956g1a
MYPPSKDGYGSSSGHPPSAGYSRSGGPPESYGPPRGSYYDDPQYRSNPSNDPYASGPPPGRGPSGGGGSAGGGRGGYGPPPSRAAPSGGYVDDYDKGGGYDSYRSGPQGDGYSRGLAEVDTLPHSHLQEVAMAMEDPHQEVVEWGPGLHPTVELLHQIGLPPALLMVESSSAGQATEYDNTVQRRLWWDLLVCVGGGSIGGAGGTSGGPLAPMAPSARNVGYSSGPPGGGGWLQVAPKGPVVTVRQHLWSVARGAILLGLGWLVEDQQVEHMDKESGPFDKRETISYKQCVKSIQTWDKLTLVTRFWE